MCSSRARYPMLSEHQIIIALWWKAMNISKHNWMLSAISQSLFARHILMCIAVQSTLTQIWIWMQFPPKKECQTITTFTLCFRVVFVIFEMKTCKLDGQSHPSIADLLLKIRAISWCSADFSIAEIDNCPISILKMSIQVHSCPMYDHCILTLLSLGQIQGKYHAYTNFTVNASG